MPNEPKSSNEQYSEEETAQRRDAVIKHMLSKPPKPHSEMTIGKRSSMRKPEHVNAGKER
jgi:hypothetical protein